MSAVYSHQTTFNRGEMSPLLAARFDIDYWRSSTALCTNFLVLRQGGLRRRSGTRFIAEVKDSSKKVRLLPFVFNASQAYVLEMGDLYTRFFANRGVLGAPYEISSDYGEADLFDLQQVQSADIMYIAHSGTAPKQLQRNGDTNWAYADVDFEDGPFLDNIRPARLTLSDTGHATPDKTSNTSGTGTASAQHNSTNAWKIFDRDKTNEYGTGANNTIPAWIKYDFGPGNDKVIKYYSISASDKQVAAETPTAWQVQGSTDDVTWVTLDAQQGEDGWSSTETRNYEFENETGYRYYRINFTELSGDSSANNVRIGEWAMSENEDNADNITVTASEVTGINDDSGFQSTDATNGRHIRIEDSDGQWRWMKITGYTSTTVVTAVLAGPPMNTASPINWRLGAFSDESGYPSSVCFFQERLCWGGTSAKPVSVWASKAGILEDHGISNPLVDDDAISITMLSSQVNQIRWIAEDENILVGSAGSVRTIGPADSTSAFSALNAEQRRHTTYGSAGLTPARAGNTTIFVGRAMRNLRELLFDPGAGGYIAPDLSVLSSHLFASGIVDMAWQQDPTPILWAAAGNGDLVAVTYDREQQVLGFARQQIAGGAVESVAVIPNQSGFDDLYLVVKRTINGQAKRYVEVLEREFDADLTAREDAVFVDSCLTYSGAPTAITSNLEHLEGETVAILADGVPLADQIVSGGQITLPGGVTASTIHVGLAYRSAMETLPVAGPGRDGTLFGRRRKPTACYVDLLDTGDVLIGAAPGGLERPSDPHGGEAVWDTAADLKSGVFRCDLDSSWTGEGRGQVTIETDRPLPATVRSLIFQIEGEP